MSRCLICGCTDEKACDGGCCWFIGPSRIMDLCEGKHIDEVKQSDLIKRESLGICSRCKDFTRANVLEKLLKTIDTAEQMLDMTGEIQVISGENLKKAVKELIRVV